MGTGAMIAFQKELVPQFPHSQEYPQSLCRVNMCISSPILESHLLHPEHFKSHIQISTLLNIRTLHFFQMSYNTKNPPTEGCLSTPYDLLRCTGKALP